MGREKHVWAAVTNDGVTVLYPTRAAARRAGHSRPMKLVGEEIIIALGGA